LDDKKAKNKKFPATKYKNKLRKRSYRHQKKHRIQVEYLAHYYYSWPPLVQRQFII